jgi:hypothetical protein
MVVVVKGYKQSGCREEYVDIEKRFKELPSNRRE